MPTRRVKTLVAYSVALCVTPCVAWAGPSPAAGDLLGEAQITSKTGSLGIEPSPFFLPQQGVWAWSDFEYLVVAPLPLPLPSTLPNLDLGVSNYFTPSTGYPAYGLPTDTIYVNGSLLQGVCVGGIQVPQFVENGSLTDPPPLAPGSSFTDTAAARIGSNAALWVHVLDEWQPDPTPGNGCAPRNVPADSVPPLGQPARNVNRPWIRRVNNGYIDLNTAYLPGATAFDGQKPTGFDGPSVYADPFDTPSGFSAVYMTGASNYGKNLSVPDLSSPVHPFFRTDNGGETWSVGPEPLPISWRPHMTSVGPSVTRPHGRVFVASCEGGVAKLRWTENRGVTFNPISATFPGPYQCVASPGHNAVADIAISRVRQGGGCDTVRVVFLTQTTPNAPVSLVPTTFSLCGDLAGVPIFQWSFNGPVHAQFESAGSSIIHVTFIEPDAFEWGQAHPGAPLPDTAVLAWDEGDPINKVGSGAAHYMVARGAQYTPPASLAPNQPFWPSFGGYGDFQDGAFVYDASKDRLNYLWMFPQQTYINGQWTAREAYNVVSISPTAEAFIAQFDLNGLAGSIALSVTVKGPTTAEEWEDTHVGFAVQDEQGVWAAVAGNCKHPDRDVASSLLSATFTCHGSKALIGKRVVAMVRREGMDIEGLPPASMCPRETRFFCHPENAYTSALGCDAAATVGVAKTCRPTPLGASCGGVASDCTTMGCCSGLSCEAGVCQRPSCAAARGVCGSSRDCCAGLSCISGACGALPLCAQPGGACAASSGCCLGSSCVSGLCSAASCAPDRGACAADGDCCTGLSCQSGACAPPVCQPQRGHCVGDGDCCTGLNCSAGFCNLP